MSEYNNENTGVFFPNNKKSEKQPDYKGKIDVEGKEYEIAGWRRTSKGGANYIRLQVQEPWKKKEEQQEEQHDLDDQIPF